MPDSLRFEVYDDVNSTSTTYDLLTSTNLRPVEAAWRVDRRGDRVMHTVPLAIKEAAANIRGDVNDLEDLLNQAILHISDALEMRSVWFREQTSGESARRSLVYDFVLTPIDDAVLDIHLDSGVARYILNFTVDRAYEEDAVQSASTTGLSVLGGKWDISGAISGGRINGRINSLLIEPQSNTVNKMWVGIRPLREGVSSFTPAHDISELIAGTGGTTVADSGARSGSYVSVSFANENLIFRFTNRTFGNDDYVGRYLVLLRTRVSSSGTICNVRASTGVSTASVLPDLTKPLNLGTTQYISNTGWEFIELGEFEFPPYRGHSRQTMTNMRLNLEIGRIAGTGDFHADCYVLVPADHLITWSNLNVANTGGGALGTDPMQAYFYTFPDGTNEGFLSDGFAPGSYDGNPFGLATISARNWSYPFAGGTLVFAAQREANQVISDTVNVSIEVFRKWTMYRV